MARSNPKARKLLAGIVAPLVKEHGGPPAVAKKVGRHRVTVNRWMDGDINWDGLAALASGLRRDVVLTFPAHGHPKATTKEPPPAWARALRGQIIREVRLNRAVMRAALEGVDPERAVEILARLEAALGQPAQLLDEDPAEQGAATAEPQPEASQS